MSVIRDQVAVRVVNDETDEEALHAAMQQAKAVAVAAAESAAALDRAVRLGWANLTALDALRAGPPNPNAGEVALYNAVETAVRGLTLVGLPAGVTATVYRIQREASGISMVLIGRSDTNVQIAEYRVTSGVPSRVGTVIAVGGSGVTGSVEVEWATLAAGSNAASQPNRGVPVLGTGRPFLADVAARAEAARLASVGALAAATQAAIDAEAAATVALSAIRGSTPRAGRLRIVRDFAAPGAPGGLVAGAGDSYGVIAANRLLQALAYLIGRHWAPPRGWVTSRHVVNPAPGNPGGWWTRMTNPDAESRAIVPGDAYRIVEGMAAAERQGLPVQEMRQMKLTAGQLAGTDGALFDYRYYVGATHGGENEFVTQAEATALLPIRGRLIGYAPVTAGAQHDGVLHLHDRQTTLAGREATVASLVAISTPGQFFAYPEITLNNPAFPAAPARPLYTLTGIADGVATGAAVGSNRYLHLAGCLFHRADRAAGPVYAALAAESMSFTDHATSAAPTVAEPKRFTDAALVSWLQSVRLDEGQPLLVVLQLNNEVGTGATDMDREFYFRDLVQRIRARWIGAASAAGYAPPKFLLIHGFAQGNGTGGGNLAALAANDNSRRAIRWVSDRYDDVAFFSQWDDFDGLVMGGQAAAVQWLAERGYNAFSPPGMAPVDLTAAPYSGDLLDALEVHPNGWVEALLMASRIVDAMDG